MCREVARLVEGFLAEVALKGPSVRVRYGVLQQPTLAATSKHLVTLTIHWSQSQFTDHTQNSLVTL